MKPAHRKSRSYATAIFIAGVLSALLAISAAAQGFSGNRSWLIFIFLIANLCFFIALFAAFTLQSQSASKQADILSNLQKRMDQYLSQVGQKKEQVVEAKEQLSAQMFAQKILPPQEQQFESLEKVTEHILTGIAREFNVVQGLFFVKKSKTDLFELQGRYAYFSEENPHDFMEGEGLSGQVAKTQAVLNVSEIPEGYITVLSGLGKGYPKQLLIIPTIWNNQCNGVLELASFEVFSEETVKLFTEMSPVLGESLHNFLKKK
ncbi:MAG TPA: GAF domain-containing protein [Williamwhitmania sp.]|nr:GAF domain-containing protein [Williamwhitmania sp.]